MTIRERLNDKFNIEELEFEIYNQAIRYLELKAEQGIKKLEITQEDIDFDLEIAYRVLKRHGYDVVKSGAYNQSKYTSLITVNLFADEYLAEIIQNYYKNYLKQRLIEVETKLEEALQNNNNKIDIIIQNEISEEFEARIKDEGLYVISITIEDKFSKRFRIGI